MTAPTRLSVVHYNHHDDATLSGTFGTSTFPLTDTQSPRRDTAVRSSGTGSYTIKGLLPASRQVSFIGLFNHWCQGCTWALNLYTDTAWSVAASNPGFSATAMATTGTSPVSWGWTPGDVLDSDPFYYEQPSWAWLGSLVTIRSYTITIAGTPTNPHASGFLQVGRVYLGPHLEFPYMPAWGFDLDVWNKDRADETAGGSMLTSGGPYGRQLEFNIEWITPAYRSMLLDLMRRTGNYRDVVVSMFPGAGGRDERDYTINGTFRPSGGISWASVNRRAKRYILREN